MKNKLLSLIGLVIITTTVIVGIKPVLAQTTQVNDEGIRVVVLDNPSFVYDFKANPGQTLTGKFDVIHHFPEHNQPATIYMEASDFTVDPETGTPIYPNNAFTLNSKYSLAKYISFDQSSFTLQKYSDIKLVHFSVNIPKSMPAGTYYASLLASNASPTEYISGNIKLNSATGSGLASRLGPVVIVTVSGNLTTTIDFNDIQILDINNNQPLLGIFEYLPVNIKVKLNNSGNAVINPGGNLFIHTGDITSPITTYKFNEDQNRLLPDSTRPYNFIWDTSAVNFIPSDHIIGGGYLALTTDKSKTLRIGKYYALAQVTYTDTNNQVHVIKMTKEFWLIPWKLLLALIILISIIVFVIYKKAKSKSKKVSSRK